MKLAFSLKEKLFIGLAMLCAFFICAEYAVIRPVSNSVFIHAYTSQWFPYAWLATIPLNLLIVSLYNRYLSKTGAWRMFLSISCLIVLGNLFCAFFLKTLPALPFLFYIWKEIYIMLMLQQLWSVINATLDMKKGKYLYGIIFGAGGAGGALGSLIPGFWAVKFGSESLLLFTFPIYALMLICFYWMFKFSSRDVHTLQNNERPSFFEGIKMFAQSRYLLLILLLVIFMQFSATVIDYQFNNILEKTILDKDLKTQYMGRVLGIINICTMMLQLVGTFLLVHFLGLRRSHFMIPITLCLNSIAFLFYPAFGMATFAYATIKVFDFSLFGVIRELLYIPLSVKEKFRAKSIIEVFAHRTSKSLASLLILGIQLVAAAQIVTILSWLSIAIFLLWSFLVIQLFKKSIEINTANS